MLRLSGQLKERSTQKLKHIGETLGEEDVGMIRGRSF